MTEVGVRELRQNASALLRRVAEGESIDITLHGRIVARLVPPGSPPRVSLDRLVSEGRARAGRGPLTDLLPVPPGPPGVSLVALIEEMRGE